jgi:predicted DNA-binding protein
MRELSTQITIRLSPELRAAIKEIEDRHRIGAAEFIRGLVEAGVAMYQSRGVFSFPVKVVPQKTAGRRG